MNCEDTFLAPFSQMTTDDVCRMSKLMRSAPSFKDNSISAGDLWECLGGMGIERNEVDGIVKDLSSSGGFVDVSGFLERVRVGWSEIGRDEPEEDEYRG